MITYYVACIGDDEMGVLLRKENAVLRRIRQETEEMGVVLQRNVMLLSEKVILLKEEVLYVIRKLLELDKQINTIPMKTILKTCH